MRWCLFHIPCYWLIGGVNKWWQMIPLVALDGIDIGSGWHWLQMLVDKGHGTHMAAAVIRFWHSIWFWFTATVPCCFQINDCGDIDIHLNASTVVKTLMHSHAPLPILYLQSHNDNRLFVESALFLSYVCRVAEVNWCLRSIVVNCQVLFQIVVSTIVLTIAKYFSS